jgi:hypothetical protein
MVGWPPSGCSGYAVAAGAPFDAVPEVGGLGGPASGRSGLAAAQPDGATSVACSFPPALVSSGLRDR